MSVCTLATKPLKLIYSIFTSHVSGRGNVLGPVCLSVCVCVCILATKPLDLHLKIGTHVLLDNISDKLEGEGHRSNVKVTKVKNVKVLFSAYYQKIRSRDQGQKVTRSKVMRSMSKLQSQGQRS